jgi:3D (Asp-Asp-Asp) domain-containing protein
MRNCSLFVSVVCLLLASVSALAVGKGQGQSERKIDTRVESKSIPASVRYEFSRTVGSGRLVKAQDGKPGEVRRTYEIIYKGNKAVDKKLIKEERVEPKPTLYLMGKAGFQPSRGAFARSSVRTMVATAYDPSPQTIGPGATGRTRTGRIATYGCVAVDPRVIPLGTLLYVEGYGFGLACDTGGAIKGNRIDLCYDSRRVANRYGKKKVQVHIFKSR